MATWNKEEFLKQFQQNENYKRALKEARDDAERKKLIAFGNDFVGSFAEILIPLLERAKNDGKFAEQLAKAINEKQTVLTGRTKMSGSNG